MKAFTMNEMETIFEIGRNIQELLDDDRIDILDSKDAFMFALERAIEFEKQNPDTEDYYNDIDDFVIGKIIERFGI